MFSRGRQCLRRHLPASLDTVAAGPDEPLLFLYPRWATSALQRHTIAPVTTAANSTKRRAARLSSRSLSVPVHTTPLPTLSRRWISTSTAARQGHVVEENKSDTVEASPKDQIDGGGEWSSNAEGQYSAKFIATVKSAAIGTLGHEQRRERKLKRAQEQQAASKAPGARVGLKKTQLQGISTRDQKKLRHGSFVQRYRKQNHAFPILPSFGWNAMQKLLSSIEDDLSAKPVLPAKSKEILVSEEAMMRLSGPPGETVLENIWFVNIRNGCQVRVLDAQKSDGIHRRVVLSGSEHVVELVEAQFNHAQRSSSTDGAASPNEFSIPLTASRNVRTLSTLEEKSKPLIRKVWSTAPSNRDAFVVDRSAIRSVSDYASRIEDLTNPGRRGHDEFQGQSSVLKLNDRVKHIVNLFQQDSNVKFVSSATLNQALKFLLHHSQFKHARMVFSKSEHVATTQTFNILLNSAARCRDVHAFRRFLIHMARSGIRPNAGTWLALLQGLIHPEAKATLIRVLAKRGYLINTPNVRSALQATIHDSFFLHLENGGNVHTFVTLLARTEGADWFSPSLLGQMFSAIPNLHDTHAANDLLDFCLERGLPIDTSYLSALLGKCGSNPDAALHYTFLAMRDPSFRINQDLLESLFFIAFNNRCVNTCRVLWGYACMAYNPTPKMKQTMLYGLACQVPLLEVPATHKYLKSLLSKVIIGATPDKFNDSVVQNLPSQFHDNPVLYYASEPKSEAYKDPLGFGLAYALVGHDMRGGKRWQPAHSLAIMLDAAITLDHEWGKTPMSLDWCLQNAIHIPVKSRENHPEL